MAAGPLASSPAQVRSVWLEAGRAREGNGAQIEPQPLVPCRCLPAPLCHHYPLPCSDWHSINLSQPVLLLHSRTRFFISTKYYHCQLGQKIDHFVPLCQGSTIHI